VETLEQYMARRAATREELTGVDGDTCPLVQYALGKTPAIAPPPPSMLYTAGFTTRRQAD